MKTQQNNSNVVTLDTFDKLLSSVIKQIQPDTILALSTGGFPVAAALAKQLGIRSRNVIGLPVYKTRAKIIILMIGS